MADPTWAKISTQTSGALVPNTAPGGWYFNHACVLRTSPADVLLTWRGLTYRYSAAANTWSRIASATNIDWRENFGSDHDTDNNVIRLGAGAPVASGNNPPVWAGNIRYDLTSTIYALDSGSGVGGNAVLVFDPLRHVLYQFAGFNQSNRTLRRRPTAGLAGTWETVGGTPTTGIWPTLVQEGARFSAWRGGIDSRTGTPWFMADDQEYYKFDPTANAWARVVTTGTKPPNTYTVFALHEALNCIVGWCGQNRPTNDPPVNAVLQTYILNLATNVWSLGPSGTNGPTGVPGSRMIPLYDRINARVLLLVEAGGGPTEVWRFTGDTIPPPPTLFAVTVTTAGNGAGSTTGAGAYASGASVVLTATAAAGSTFAGWAISNPPGGSSGSFSMPAAAVTATATFTLNPVPPPPPPPVDLNLPVRQFTAFPLPAITANAAPFSATGDTKDVNWTYDTLRRKLIMGTGDFSFASGSQSGRAEIFTYTPETNSWAMISGTSHPPGQITPNHPSDRGPMVYDSLRDRLWLSNAVPFPDQEGQTTPGGSIYRSGLLYMDMTSRIWTQVSPTAFGSLGNGVYDTAGDAMIFFDGSTACPGSPGRLNILPLSNPTGPRQTFDLCLTPAPKFTSASGGWVAPQQPQRSMFAWDDVGRVVYVVTKQLRLNADGSVAETRASLYQFSRATNTWTTLLHAPLGAGIALDPFLINIVWDSASQKVLWPVVSNSCGQVKQLLAYDPATNTWEDVNAPLAGVFGNTIAYHPGVNAMLVAGSVFCEIILPDYTQTHLRLYRHSVAPPSTPDTTPPTCALTAPAANVTISGAAVAVTATASDNVGVTRVEFYVDGTLWATDLTAPYAATLNTLTLPNDLHSLFVRAYDAALNVTQSATVTVTVFNAPQPPPVVVPPTCAITSPTAGALVSGAAVAITATAAHAAGIASLTLLVDGAATALVDTTSPYTFTWDSTAWPDGAHVLQVKAVVTGAPTNTAISNGISVTVDNVPPADTEAPVCAMTFPTLAGSTLSGVVTVTATASDDVAVVRVELWLSGVPIMADLAAPYSFAFNTVAQTNGPYLLGVRAYDAAGNIGAGTDLPIVISNTPPTVPPPTVTITDPAGGSTIHDTQVFVIETNAVGPIQVTLEVDSVLVDEVASLPATLPQIVELTLDTLPFSNGPHLVTVLVRTNAGLVNTATLSYIFDNVQVIPEGGGGVSRTVFWSAPETSFPNSALFTKFRIIVGDLDAIILPITARTYTFTDLAPGIYSGRVELISADESQVHNSQAFTLVILDTPAPVPALAQQAP